MVEGDTFDFLLNHERVGPRIEVALDSPSTGLTMPAPDLGRADVADEVASHLPWVGRSASRKQAVDVVLEQLRDPTHGECDERLAEGHAFQEGAGQRILIDARNDDDVEVPHVRLHVRTESEKEYVTIHADLSGQGPASRQMVRRCVLRGITEDHELAAIAL